MVRCYITDDALGAIKVADVRRRDVQAFADELLASGSRGGTVSNILNPVQTFYRRAIDREELAYNPASRIDLPARPIRDRSGSHRLDEAAALSTRSRDDRALWATAFYAGCGAASYRPSAALTWTLARA